MTEQATEVNHDQEYTPQHGNGYHPPPLHAEPAATYGITPSSSLPPRAWPLGLRLATGVLMIGLAAGLVVSLITLRSVTVRESHTDTRVSQLYGVVGLNASQASQASSKTGGSVASLQSQLGTVEAQLAALARRVSHHGMCVSFSRNTGNGDLVDVNITTPQMAGGQVACQQGSLVSVVPAP